jgi:Bacteriophage Lambda NinG protein
VTPKPPKPKKCKVCATTFTPARPFQTWCSPECGLKLALAKKAKADTLKAREEKRADKAKRESLKTISQLESECREIVQKIARIRDRHDGCISCHMGANYGGQWHGSHYRAHGGCSSLQFQLWNIHKACAQCNLFKGGNREGYVQGLLSKPGYGRERIEWLDAQPKSKRFTRDYLERFKRVMGKRCRRLEKSANQDR